MMVRSFTGRTIPEALEKVRQQLGPNALIIETRNVNEPGLLGRKIGVEVIAACDGHPNQRQRSSDAAEARSSTAAVAERPPASRGVSTHAESAETPWHRIDLPELPAPRSESGSETANQASALQSLRHLELGNDDVSHELASIRRQLARLAAGQSTPSAHLGEILVSQLEDVELPGDCIAELDDAIAQAGERLPTDRRLAFAEKLLARSLHCPGAIDWNHCHDLLLVGPTGVGKTTTIAKLAGELVLRQHRRIALITIDTYRIGAADQLRAYADLLDVPFEVAQTPAQLHAALARFADYDNVLIDTAGRSHADSARILELKGFCRQHASLQVCLTVSATCGRAEFAAVVERFSILPIQHAIVTKLDECMAHGRLYGCLRRHHLPVSYVTMGQEVPDDIKAADRSALAHAVLHSEPARA
ncbi:MAG: flagellar biosynthesis protein FlhF [Planctomycetota bacterium]